MHTRLRDVDVSWCVTAGWALDLFRGEVTREHDDIEIAVPAAGLPAVREVLADLTFDIPGAGQRWTLDSPAYGVLHQTWGRDGAGIYRLDVFREPHDGGTWICRRDERIRLPYAAVIEHTAAGVPYMAPEIVLLFKAKHARDKDHADLRGVLPLLDTPRLAWLHAALTSVHPGHAWLAELSL